VSDLPSGWEWTTIGELLTPLEDGRTVHQGWSPRCETHPAPDGSWGVLKTTAIQPGSFRPECNKALPPNLDPRPGIEVRRGDLLLTCAGPRARCGVACLVGSTRPLLMVSGKMYRFRVNETHVSARYLDAYLQSARAWSDIDAMKTGGSDSGLNLTQARFRRLAVPLAPRHEQERIVAAIEERISRLENAVSSLELGRNRLRLLEQIILDSAVAGETVPLGELLSEPLRNGMSAKAAPNGSVRVVTLTAVTRSEFTDEHTKLVDLGRRSVDDLWMRPGDVFIQRSNTPELVGSAALYSGPERWAIFPDLLIRVRVDHERIDPAYLETVLRSSALRRYFQGSAQGIAGSMPKISQPIVEAAPIPVPSLERQQSVLRRLQSERATLGRVSVDLSRFAGLSNALRRSVLSTAFSGQLVPQDPGDEPASALLERIRMEREAAPSCRRRTRS